MKSSPGLHIIIVGAGITGLATATSLRRAGHTVHLYEKSAQDNEIGAAIYVPPNVSQFLLPWGLDLDKWGFVKSQKVSFLHHASLETKMTLSDGMTAKGLTGAELYYAHRVDLHGCLRWMATRPEGPGRPATIHLMSNVVAYDPLAPSITLASGEVISADVVIGADGVRSDAVEAIIGDKVQTMRPRFANTCYRFLVPADAIEADPATQFWNEGSDGWSRVMIESVTGRSVVSYPCRSNTIHNFVLINNEENDTNMCAEDWHARFKIPDILKKFSDYDPRLLKVLSKAPDARRWPLIYRKPIHQWTKGCMTLAGDACHAMLPFLAQGGAQGIEDAVALGVVLQGATTRDDIQKRLQIYQEVRMKRASIIQILSNMGADHSVSVEDLKEYLNEDQMPYSQHDMMIHNYKYDVAEVAFEAMKRYDPSFRLGNDFLGR
ncbi:FAD binding domain-containing protein [Aspergillus candidus]|uniref:FAD-dependent monooxygenase cfoG n=1 Tax=Aspergillus candidus TaxID=41067 RepID=CFOG_ASPCN|nr:FAD binding domain-containing protein [Aspergillus candidus]A0A2I2F2Q7.1 RecName: Full=FAD-dependent monooxygenase cfoG; AltName: Full=Chlorflavonin biosynthesis cluster protein G; Flags: Precursor [Aspergillus candidus]PLB34866.1 FAD binding domain-containing protein [Aspergillus candidus]